MLEKFPKTKLSVCGGCLQFFRCDVFHTRRHFYLFNNSKRYEIKTGINVDEVKDAHSMVVTGFKTANVTPELN